MYVTLDKHIQDGYGDQVAFMIHQCSKYGKPRQNSWEDAILGLKKGDTAIIYMPMIPQAAQCAC
jgi:propionyl-CoA synthetase